MELNTLLLVPMLLPVLSGLLIGFFHPLREFRAQRIFLTTALLCNVAAVLVLLVLPDMRLDLFHLAEDLPIMFQTDGPARMFCLLAALMFRYLVR